MLMKNVDSKEQEAQIICTSCGLCCDGTLFTHANLIPEDSDENLNAAGILAVQSSEKRYFQLPCHHLENRRCKIYHMWRPHVCGRFRCKILQRLSTGELSFEQGMEIAKKAREHIAELEHKINDTDVPDKMSIHDRFKALESRQNVKDMSVILNYAALLFRLNRDFIKKKKDSIGHSDK